MAIGKASDFVVYQDQFQTGVVETLIQNTDAFNEASRGAIRLSTVSRRGDFSQQAFFKNTANLITLISTEQNGNNANLGDLTGLKAQDVINKSNGNPQIVALVQDPETGKLKKEYNLAAMQLDKAQLNEARANLFSFTSLKQEQWF